MINLPIKTRSLAEKLECYKLIRAFSTCEQKSRIRIPAVFKLSDFCFLIIKSSNVMRSVRRTSVDRARGLRLVKAATHCETGIKLRQCPLRLSLYFRLFSRLPRDRDRFITVAYLC